MSGSCRDPSHPSLLQVRIGINNQLGGEYGEPIAVGGPGDIQHDHGMDLIRSECEHQLRLIEVRNEEQGSG